ncbi:hypothetical protein [Tahibacter sp.]|uniref:hypothetical protein n=1 Tax=Tahibacter sp. TaxID=2056211 RepID=UPI0028C451FC|nr:hypothetical protein [Tahibacter sp.]
MASRKPSTEIPAKRAPARLENDRDARFQALLRAACVKAAGVGALSALVGAIPGAGVLLRFTLGELADAAAVGAIQEKLIEDTLALYELPLPEALRKPLIAQISALGAGASLGVDAIGRRILGRFGSKLGGTVFGRVAPLVGVLTSALGNAATTYAIGRRAEAFAKMGAAPADSLVDAFRAFTGVDERRVWEWSVAATKDALGTIGRVTAKMKAMNPFSRWEVPDVETGEDDPAANPAETAAEKPKAARKPHAAADKTASPSAKKASKAAKATRGAATKSAAKAATANKAQVKKAAARKPTRKQSPD